MASLICAMVWSLGPEMFIYSEFTTQVELEKIIFFLKNELTFEQYSAIRI
jgi:hypothetical protein